jgi:LysM repeat protein
MSAKVWFIKGLLFLTCVSLAEAAPLPSRQEDPWRHIRNALSDLKVSSQNHEIELRMFAEKLQTQDSSFDQINQELQQTIQAHKDFTRSSLNTVEAKLETVEQSVKGVMADIRQLKTQANESVNLLTQYKHKLTELDELLQAQHQYVKNLESALASVVEVLQVNTSNKTHKVQSGETLEKIARSHKISLQALKEINQLNHDRIIVGQVLKLP